MVVVFVGVVVVVGVLLWVSIGVWVFVVGFVVFGIVFVE